MVDMCSQNWMPSKSEFIQRVMTVLLLFRMLWYVADQVLAVMELVFDSEDTNSQTGRGNEGDCDSGEDYTGWSGITSRGGSAWDLNDRTEERAISNDEM